jgi:hypothetical protein
MGLYPKALEAVLAGLPWGPNSNAYIVDPVNGDDDNDGKRWSKPLKTVAAAEALCTANQNDVVVFVGGPTADALTAPIAWDKDYTHLVGLSSDLPGLGQRCRLTGSATADLTELMTISGNGCIFRNLQFYNGADAEADSGAVILTGDRCEFTNVMFSGINNEAVVGVRAGAFSLKLSAAVENYFRRCAIGSDTIVRAAANAELVMLSGSSKNTFEDCMFMSASSTAGKFMVSIDQTSTPTGLNYWKRCLFYNNSTNWVQALDNAFEVAGSQTHYLVLHDCQAVGITGWADVVAHLYCDGPAPDAGFGISTQPTT